MAEDLFFNKLVTKSMEAVHGDERFFEGYLTVQIKDKQGEITVVDELYKVLPIWMDRGAPISDTHSNRIIGKGINYSKATYKDTDGEEYPAIKITGKIHKDYELDNEIWKKIKSGEYKGLSFGGATKSDRDPVRMKDGSIAYSLKDLEHYEVAVCADPAVPLALITDYNPVAKSATNAVVREDGKMVIKCDKFGCYVSKVRIDHKDDDVAYNKKLVEDITSNMGVSNSSTDEKEKELKEAGVETRRKPCKNCGDKKGLIETKEPDGSWSGILNPTKMVGEERKQICPHCNESKVADNLARGDPADYGGKSPKEDVGKADNITKPIPDSKGGKGDFDHCEEKNQDKDDPAAFCGAIQHKLEKAVEAGMIQQVAKDGLEIFLTKEELNKVCSGCGKTLGEHGIVKYDHSNSMGDQHSMYNQNTGRETWVGQGLPQPTVEGKDDHPAEQGLTINGDAMQNSGKKKKKLGKSFITIVKDEEERREHQAGKERKRNQNFFGDFSGDPDKMTPTPEQIANKKIRDAKEADILARKKLKRGKKKKSFELFKDSVDGKQSPTRKPSKENPQDTSTRRGRGISPTSFQGQATDARLLDIPHTTGGLNQRKREHKQVGDITIPSLDRKREYEPKGRKEGGRSKAPTPQGGRHAKINRKPKTTNTRYKPKKQKKETGREREKLTLGHQKRTDQPTPPKVNTTPTENMKKPSKYTKEEWDKLPQFFKDRDFKAQSDELKELQRKVDVLSQQDTHPYKEKRPAETKEDWKKIDDEVQSERAKEIEDRAASGIQYGKSFGFISKKKPQTRGQAIRDFNIDDEIEGDYQTSGWLGISPSANPKKPNIMWGSKEESHDTDIPENPDLEVFPRKSLVNKRDDWDKEEKDNTDAYFGRNKPNKDEISGSNDKYKRPWTSRDQSEYDAFEKLSKLPKKDLDKLGTGLQEAIDGIKLEGKIREGMIGTFGKSLESIVSKKRTSQSEEEYNRAGEGRDSWRPDFLDDTDEPEKSERNVDDETTATNLKPNDPKRIPKSRVRTEAGISPLGMEIAGQKYTTPYAGVKDHEDLKEAYENMSDKDKLQHGRVDDAVEMGSMDLETARAEKSLESIFKREGANQAWGFKKDKMEPVLGNIQSNKGEDAEANPDMSPEEWLQWYKKRPKTKAEKVTPEEKLRRHPISGEQGGSWQGFDEKTGKDTEEHCPWCFPKKLVDGVLDSKRGNDKEYPMEVSNDWERKIHDMSPDGMDSIHHSMRATGAKRPNVDFPSKYDKKEHKKIMEKERKEEKDRKHGRDRAEEMRKPKPKPEKRTWHNREEWQPPKGGTVKSLESIVDKAEESNFGGGQRGLGYGNEGHTVVQGSGQSHTITEIPPEMEVIVHDVNEIKESKKEGYTTEAGNSKRGDPSRATDDDDSLLTPTFAKKEYGQWLSPKKPTGEEDDDNFEEFGLSDDDTNETPKKNSLATDFNEPWFT